MTPIKPILIALILLLCLFSLRSKLVTRLTGIVFAAIAATAIMYPDLTNRVAHMLGVGRGADLLLYLFSLVAVYGILSLYVRTRRLETLITNLARTYALEHAEPAAAREQEAGITADK